MENPFRRFTNWLRNYFGFSQRETNGFLVLLCLMCLCMVFPALVRLFIPKYDPAKDQQLLDSLVAQIQKADTLPAFPKAHKPVLAEGNLPSAPFDPNTLTTEDWVKLGLPKHLANRIKNYQAKGGMFKVKEDIARIYDFPEPLYRKLYPLIALPTRAELLANRNKPRYPAKANSQAGKANPYPNYSAARIAPLQPFNLNQADTTQLKRIKGIGSKRAEWIVKYRKRLGGFVSTQQLSEVFGLDSAIVDSLQKYAFVAPDFKPAKVYINRMTTDELGRHPYLNFKIARAIVAYREQHGPYKSTDDLRKVKLVTEQTLSKLRPYLEF